LCAVSTLCDTIKFFGYQDGVLANAGGRYGDCAQTQALVDRLPSNNLCARWFFRWALTAH